MSALSLDEVLVRLSRLNLDPFEAAEWLNLKHRTARITLLADGARVAPQDNPTAVLIQAKPAPDGRARLEVVMRGAFKVPLDRVKEFCAEKEWSVERQSFEAEVKASRRKIKASQRKSGGGRPREHDREKMLVEALVLVGVYGFPARLSGDNSLVEKVMAARDLPPSSTTTVEDVLREPFNRIKAEREANEAKKR